MTTFIVGRGHTYNTLKFFFIPSPLQALFPSLFPKALFPFSLLILFVPSIPFSFLPVASPITWFPFPFEKVLASVSFGYKMVSKGIREETRNEAPPKTQNHCKLCCKTRCLGISLTWLESIVLIWDRLDWKMREVEAKVYEGKRKLNSLTHLLCLSSENLQLLLQRESYKPVAVEMQP